MDWSLSDLGWMGRLGPPAQNTLEKGSQAPSGLRSLEEQLISVGHSSGSVVLPGEGTYNLT